MFYYHLQASYSTIAKGGMLLASPFVRINYLSHKVSKTIDSAYCTTAIIIVNFSLNIVLSLHCVVNIV